MKTFLIIVIAFLQVAIAYIPSRRRLSTEERGFFKHLTIHGKWFIFLCGLTVVFTFWLYLISEAEQVKSQKELINSLRKRDSVTELRRQKLIDYYSKKVDSIYLKSQKTFIDVTAHYGLHYDSLNSKLVQRIDTTKKELLPDLNFSTLRLDSTQDQQYFFSTVIQCLNAPAREISLNYEYVTEDYQGTLYYVKIGDQNDNIPAMSTGSALQQEFTITEPSDSKLKILFVRVQGTYHNLRKDAKLPYLKWRMYNLTRPKDNNFGIPYQSKITVLNNFLKSKH